MAVYGGNDPEYLKREKLKQIKKSLPPGKGWTGEYDQFGREYDTTTGKLKEALSRLTYHSDFAKKDSEKEEEHRQRDARMKHGKNWEQFTKDVESAKERLRPGEVKRWDKKEKRWISNLEKTK
jgi:hypothetical protein